MDKNKTSFIGMAEEDFPDYLRSYDALAQYFRAQLNGLSTVEKGDRFAHAVAKLIPQTDAGIEFDLPTLNKKKSGDGGVDLIAPSKSSKKLYIQSKLWVDKADDIDSVMSKFQSYENSVQDKKGQLLIDYENLDNNFMLVTLSSLENLLSQYKKKAFSSKGFYEEKMMQKKLHFIDGPQIITILRAAYSKINKINTTIVLDLEANFIHKDNVFVGIISNQALKKLYDQMGDALFFENIRDFLGINVQERVGRKTPNNEIIKTITSEADKMLARNNGIVFSASKVEIRDDKPNQLILHNGSIVNGCQTTMCVVEYAKQDCFVLAKVVEISEAWDIAKSANYQNSVADIDLELAQYLRPQLVKRAAAFSGVQMNNLVESPFQIIEEIYDRKIAYDETRLTYIGIFSRSPKNVFVGNYTDLQQDLLQRFYKDDKFGETIFDLLFTLQTMSQKGLKLAEDTFEGQTYSKMFERLYKDDNLSYRCFISILVLCGLTNADISERKSDVNQEYTRMKQFLREAQRGLQNDQEKFLRYYLYAVKIWMQDMNIDADPKEIQHAMSNRSRGINFTRMFRDFCIERDMQEKLQKL